MLEIKEYFLPSKAREEGKVILEISLNNSSITVDTGIELSLDTFETIKNKTKDEDTKQDLLLTSNEIKRSKCIIHKIFNKKPTTSLSEITKLYYKEKAQMTLFRLFKTKIEDKLQEGAIATSSALSVSLSCFQKLLNYNDCTISSINKTTIKNWVKKLEEQNISHNTQVFYLRKLKGLLSSTPNKLKFKLLFEDYNLQQQTTKKNFLSKEEVLKLLNSDLGNSKKLQKARDFFIMSLFLRGMAIIDLVYLKKSSLSDNIIKYTRHKTKKELQVKMTQKAEELLKKYKSEESSSYLLNILRDDEDEQATFRRYKNFLRTLNRNLNLVGKFLEFNTPLSSNLARHTWTNQAIHIGTPLALISESLGHSNEEFTADYLKQLKQDKINDVNNDILNNIFT